MNHAERCPVCNGTGRVPRGFYSLVGNLTTTNEPEVCKSCLNGIVVISDDPLDAYKEAAHPAISLRKAEIEEIICERQYPNL